MVKLYLASVTSSTVARLAYTMALDSMDSEIIWLIAMVVFTVGEMATLGFFLAPFAVGALFGLIVDLVGGGIELQLAAAVVGTAGSFLVLRPIAVRHMNEATPHATNTEALIGKNAIVVDKIVNNEGVGTVRIGGEVWTARTQDDEVLDAGAKVKVIEIRGVTAVVAP
jgi:membrane protein implicated in regulation of membrane protease activity